MITIMKKKTNMLYKISTTEKKNAVQITTFRYDVDDKTWYFDFEEGYRWGTAVIELCEEPNYPESEWYNEGFCLDCVEVSDMDLNDGCSGFFYYPEDMPQELREKIEGLWDEGGYEAFEDEGIEQWDCSTTFYGPIEFDLVDDTPCKKVEPDPTKPAWPFS